jgi:iron complex outermembrane receptor protein
MKPSTRIPLCAVLLSVVIAAPGLAQVQTASKAAVTAAGDDVIALPEFRVGGAADDGWTAASSMSGTRTNIAIQDLPRSVQVLTSEFLSDISAKTMSDAVEFMTGVVTQGKQDAVFDNNTVVIRGMRQNRHYRDGVRESFPGMINDSASIDRIESLRGPSSLLAGVSEPGGMLNQLTKRPRTKRQAALEVTTGSWSFFRTEADLSLPVTEQFGLRAVAAWQDTDSWRPWEGSKRTVGYLAGVYKFTPNTIVNARAESIDYLGVMGINGNYAIRLPGANSNVSGFVPESILPWDFNPFGPNSLRDHQTYRVSADLQHKFNLIFSLRSAILWSKSDRRDLRPSSNATTIYTRYLNPALGNVAGNVVPDEIRWSATRDDEDWDIWTYQTDLRGVFEYAGLKHEALLGYERIESRNWRDRVDTPNATTTAPSTNPNALTRYKFPTSASGALPEGSSQPAWTQLTDLARYTTPNVYLDQTIIRNAVSFANVFSSNNGLWHALAGLRKDYGDNSALNGATTATATPALLPKENATSHTLGVLYRPWPAISFYVSESNSFAGVPSGFDQNLKVLTKPEAGKSLEGGIKSSFLGGKLGLEAAVYKLDRTNVRRQLTDSELIAAGLPAGGTARYVQDAGEQAKGWEIQLLFRPLKGYQISANYTNVDAIVTKTENVLRIGGPIAGRGRESGNLFQKFTFGSGPLKDLSLSNGLVWIDGTRPDAYDSATGKVSLYIPGYTRIDLGLGYRFALMGHACDLTVRVRNAADKHYIEGAQSKGDVRNYRIGLSGKF